MTKTLNITNGDSAVAIMRQADIPGDFLPWRDVLHDGPVPGGLSLDALSAVRADFIVSQGWGEAEQIKNDFIDRDSQLRAFEDYNNVILWFEHDLYDQLQILQILDWFQNNLPRTTGLSMICTDQYLGLLSADEMANMFCHEITINEEQLKLASKAWSAFCSKSPETWQALLVEDTSALPFLDGAVLRLLEEYPNSANGLSRSAKTALELVAQGTSRPGKVFSKYQDSEERKFMGDSSFWVILNELLLSSPPLLKLTKGSHIKIPLSPDHEIEITQTGIDVLAGRQNFLDCIELDRWIGGVHLSAHNFWCWDSSNQKIVRTEEMKSLKQTEYIELAKSYVALSNAHALRFIFPMFVDSASYQSSSVGSFNGRTDIENMMTGFFAGFPDVFWQVPEFRYANEGLVEFEFVMTAINIQSGEAIERKGLETIQFTNDGFIEMIRVDTH